MDRSQQQSDSLKSTNDVARKKLEAELRATEEIARIRQHVIEKRLAVELATLGEQDRDGMRAQPEEQPPQQQKTSLKPLFHILPKVPIADQTKSKPLKKPVFTPEPEYQKKEEPHREEETYSEEVGYENSQIKKRSSFLKGVMNKFKRRMKPEERDEE